MHGGRRFLPKLRELSRVKCIDMIKVAHFTALEILTGVSCPIHARGPPLSKKMREILMAGMELDPPP